jgi:hypothetical protein
MLGPACLSRCASVRARYEGTQRELLRLEEDPPLQGQEAKAIKQNPRPLKRGFVLVGWLFDRLELNAMAAYLRRRPQP